MRVPTSAWLALLAVPLLGAPVAARYVSPRSAPERIQPNDNRRPGGTLRGGVLTLRLEARTGMWHPDGDDAPGAAVPAFAEVGRPLRIPGPMIRVPAGTELRVSVRNAVPGSTLAVHGLVSRPVRAGAAAPPLSVPHGATREVRLRLDVPGTYHYWGTTTGRPFAARTREDAQLSGAIVVDAPGADTRRERVLVIGGWSDTTGVAARETNVQRQRILLVVNGRSWPHTERLSYTVGDTVRWRVINASADLHPMHLHGFYYHVDAEGDGLTDSTYDAARRELVVTHPLRPARTMRLTWIPERPGNWLFHCHTPPHFAARKGLGMARDSADQARAHHVDNHALQGMNGLVVGVHVAPAPGAAAESAPEPARRRLRLLARPNAGGTEALPLYGFALHERGAEPPPDSGVRAGPPIVLTRDEPVSIMVVNRMPEETAVHWHGIELDSYFDGVAGFSGTPARLSPSIAPGDSFEVRFTPPRAGTFIYHTHADEMRQQPAGLAGPLLVLEPGRTFDAATDVPVIITSPRRRADEVRAVQLNGSMTPAPLDVRVGVPLRLRFINMTTGRAGMQMELRRNSAVVSWRALAKDGAELPPARQVNGRALQKISIGETYDFAFTPTAAGTYTLEARMHDGRLLATLPLRATMPPRTEDARR